MANWLSRIAAVVLLVGIPPLLEPEPAHARVCGVAPTVAESVVVW